ncbi:hypothetical protein VaNZ11_001148 [Volvox africanus]|uniref:Uncharacterized protein n=1 Tax=Volvox africanus TaxID=51714 RepID=A0ABQ5RP00_9CHLO|nr:hypothetical protein VaNZ11_001148 [Volvox africanus]
MELPRRRTGSYEPRSAIGNVLAPVSGLQGSAEVRTTPSVRGVAATAAPKPPWATELDVSDVSQSQAAPHQQHPPSGRSSSNSRPQRSGGKADQDAFSFHTPAPAATTVKPSSPEAFARHPDLSSTSWDKLSGPWPNTTPAPARPQSGGRTGPADQIGLWSQQQHQHVRRNEELYARVEHLGVPSTAQVAVASNRRGAPAAAVAAPRRGGTEQKQNRSNDGLRPPPSDDASPIALRSNATTGPGGAGGATSRTSAPTARAVHSNESRTPGRSTSTPKPRPAAPPKRSTSITDNARRDWVDVSAPDRQAGGSTTSKDRSGGGSGGGHWDADPDGHDRGSWLFSGDAEQQPSGRDPEPDPLSASDRRRLPGRPSSAGHAGSGDGGPGDGGRGRMPSGRQERHPPPLPRPRPQSPALGDLEATFSPPAAAPSVVLAGSSSTGEISLGHGPTADLGSRSRGASTAGHGNGRPGGPSGSQIEAARHTQALQEENSRLRDQVQHLERLLAAVTPVAAVEAGRSRKGSTTLAARPSSAGCMDAASSIAAAAAGGVVLQQYKSQVIQLQRQVALMSQEIEAKTRISFEAEGALLEMASKLAELAAAGGNSATGTVGKDTVPGVAAEAAAGLSSGGEALSRDRLMQLHKWSKQMLGRLRSEKSESSKLFTQQAYDSRGPRGGGQGAASWADRGSGTTAAAEVDSFAPTWVVPFLPAGGNRFLLAGSGGADAAGEAAADDLAGAAGGGGGTSMAAIASGQAVLLADPLLAHRLDLQLAAVAPKLAALAVLLKTQLLPAMPWLGLDAADRLQAEVGEASEGVAQSVEALVQLCSLLPAGAAVFGEGPVAQEPKRRAAEVDAGRDSWLFGSPELLDAPEPRSPAVNDEGVISVPRLQAAIAPLLRDRKTGSKALADILEAVRAKSQSAAAKRAVLETELHFAARASALHAEHVSHLMLSVGMALEECRGAKDAAMIKSYFNGAAAVRQVLEAADALELHPCETCLKALVDVIQVHRETLGRLPELLVNAPAADVEGRLLSKVEELHQGFKKAVSRLEVHKRRHMDALARGGVGGTAGDQDLNSNDEDFEEHQNEEHGGSGGEIGRKASRCVGTSEQLGAAAARRPPSTSLMASPPQQQQITAVKPGKPPKPRPEWMD